MSDLTLSVTKREGFGRGISRRLRAQGKVPAVLYGKEGEATHCQVDDRAFRLLLREIGGRATVITLDNEGTETPAVIQQTQRNPLTDKFEHVDFMVIEDGRPLTYKVPIKVKGEAYGVRNEKGVLNMMVRTLDVRCQPKDLPEWIEIDVTDLKKSEGIQIGKLTPPEGCKFTGRPDVVVVIVTK
jgi:large subunit ribosomal protein L25